MIVSQGQQGRVFVVLFEDGDEPAQALAEFAASKEIPFAEVLPIGGGMAPAVLAPDADGRHVLLPAPAGATPKGAVVREITGVHLRSTAGGTELERVAQRAAPHQARPALAAAASGPGLVPVYLFNAEFN